MSGQWYRSYGKRILDLGLAIAGLLLFSPLLALVAVLVRLKMGSPVLFQHPRAGFQGQPFTLYKFRSMTDQRDAVGRLLPDSQRLTPFGRFLRSSSLDELPELINLVLGSMSMVGPRPLLREYLDRYSPEQMRRHEVMSGITGWAQINGRNTTTWERKFALDVYYVDHVSLAFDLKILILTVWKTLKREGINQPGQATVENFGSGSPETGRKGRRSQVAEGNQ